MDGCRSSYATADSGRWSMVVRREERPAATCRPGVDSAYRDTTATWRRYHTGGGDLPAARAGRPDGAAAHQRWAARVARDHPGWCTFVEQSLIVVAFHTLFPELISLSDPADGLPLLETAMGGASRAGPLSKEKT